MREKILTVYNTSLDKKISHLYKGLVDRVELTGDNNVSVFVQKKYK
jgi:hypothetical protein